MAGDQQFCLRWNNHQSTLVSVFDSLLENSVLVDCTLAADGQQLKAHKVVLSACSPYLETLLSQHYDKHPIIILKDVKYPELKAMLDYMYRGEVNISQDLLGSFLKAAESLQIKGLTDSGGGGEPPNKQSECNRKHAPLNQPTTLTHVVNNHNRTNSGSLSYSEDKKQAGSLVIPAHVLDSRSQSPLLSREGSISPTVRKRKKLNQLNKMDNPKLVKPLNDSGKSNNCQNEQPTSQTALSSPATMAVIKSEPDLLPLSNKTEFKQNIDDSNGIDDAELDNDENNENVYEDDTTNTTTSPGPSHHFISQGFNEKSSLNDGSNEIILQSSDELQSSNQDTRMRMNPYIQQMKSLPNFSVKMENQMQSFPCQRCGKVYNRKGNLGRHIRYECEQFLGDALRTVWPPSDSDNDTPIIQISDSSVPHVCPRCGKKYSLKGNLTRHIRFECGKEPQFQCHVCMKTFTRNDTLSGHLKMLHRIL